MRPTYVRYRPAFRAGKRHPWRIGRLVAASRDEPRWRVQWPDRQSVALIPARQMEVVPQGQR